MTLMSFAIPLGRSGARVTLHNVGIRLRLCEREVLWLSLARKWMVSFQGWKTEPKAGDGTHITVDPRIQRPGLVLTKHLSIPQQGQQTPTHASVLQPHPSGLCRRFGHGPELLAVPCSAPLAPSTAALHARAFNGTQGQLGKIWGWKADGPYNEAPHWAVNDRADVISCMFWCIFFFFVKQEWNEGSNLQHVLHSDTHITPTFRFTASKPLQTKKSMKQSL